MGRIYLLSLFILVFNQFSHSQIKPPLQPDNGPGGKSYIHLSVEAHDFANEPDGYWLFEPADPKPDSAHVLVFVHGYGGYNPMIYGGWIKHLVKKGSTVIFPRYQRDMLSPHPNKFSENVAKAISDAITELNMPGHVKPITNNLVMAGHSYGGVVCADLAINYDKYQIPQPRAVMLVSPGSGKLTGGRLENYAGMPPDISLLIIVSEEDYVVGDEFAVKVFKEATMAKNRNLLRQYPDAHGTPPIKAQHNEAYSLDMGFDNGIRNFTSKRALRIAQENAVDYFGYWKLLDALIECTRNNSYCSHAFGGTKEQTYLGVWSDGTPVKPMEVFLPDK